jgi:hypothetical protein
MAQETPIVQVIDSPILPLKEDRIGKLMGMLVGGSLAGLFIVAWITIKRLYKQIMD